MPSGKKRDWATSTGPKGTQQIEILHRIYPDIRVSLSQLSASDRGIGDRTSLKFGACAIKCQAWSFPLIALWQQKIRAPNLIEEALWHSLFV